MQGSALARDKSCTIVTALMLVAMLAPKSWAQQGAQATVAGSILDPLGARVPSATVKLLRDGKVVTETASDGLGQFSFAGVESGRYQVEVKASGFEPQMARTPFVGTGQRVTVNVPLQIGLKQDVVVTASATEASAAQVGAPVTVIDRQTIDDLAKPALLEALRLVPGSQVVQTGGQGGVTSIFVRGGASNFNKVLVDGIPVNDIGGSFDYSDFATTGVESVEALRDANSVLYGSDAMAGVISITTRRGRTRTPELTATVDGGNLGSHREEASLGGTAQRFDYFGAYSHQATDNRVPNNRFKNDTFVARVGWALGSASDVSATVRHSKSDYGVPNSFDFFGIADDSRQSDKSTYLGLIAQSQFTPAWHGVLRLASFQDDYDYVNPSPTGTPYDPFGFGASYLGNTMTIRGANGTATTGRAILDFGGAYPQLFVSAGKRRAASAQVTFQALQALALSGGGRIEREEGFSRSGTSAASATDRDNYGAFLEARAKLRRFYATAGIGYENNEVFDSAWTPRLSAALYLREPSATGSVGDTKLVFNVGSGIKAPNISQEKSSLVKLLALAPNVTTLAPPIGPERARTLDVGVEQGLWRGQLRVRVSYFDNRYEDLIEFLSKPALLSLGIPAPVVSATRFGAYVNSSTQRARGIEASTEAKLVGGFRIMASYTYLDAEVLKSFSSSALGPVENPAYPGVKIGAFGPLVGARPFRRPTNSGSLLVTYAKGPAQVSVSGYLAGTADDSTFLSDADFGNSMLLPNGDLNAGYQKIDVSGSYRLAQSRVKLYVSAENILDRRYTAAFGFPALPRTVRVGISGTLGGDGSYWP